MATRSIDGRIPRTNVSDAQVTASLVEYVKKFEVTDMDKFVSQSDERAKMNHRIMESVNQEIDYNIMTELANATTTATASGTGVTLATMTKTIAQLAANQVAITPNDVTWVISPFMEAKLQQIAQKTSWDYVPVRTLESGGNQFQNERKIQTWLNVSWIVHPNLPGVGTNACTTYLYHRNAVGFAVPTNQMMHSAGYDDQDHYHYCSATMKAATKILQQPGVFKFVNDDTA